jgi:hypothetical protein
LKHYHQINYIRKVEYLIIILLIYNDEWIMLC